MEENLVELVTGANTMTLRKQEEEKTLRQLRRKPRKVIKSPYVYDRLYTISTAIRNLPGMKILENFSLKLKFSKLNSELLNTPALEPDRALYNLPPRKKTNLTVCYYNDTEDDKRVTPGRVRINLKKLKELGITESKSLKQKKKEKKAVCVWLKGHKVSLFL
eukprot:TRINITY_DN10975_c0_g1_i11.p1 TRINITY_DN10975_c0_g1~~TRINITY_DN10975_c0_g1_i11.p1  ORF type:complete len:162 (-),score=41.22 TRINITY_DN10975_c0_g1_i11:208-693(-)